MLQPTSPKFQDFAEQVRDRALIDYNYTFSENEEVSFVHFLLPFSDDSEMGREECTINCGVNVDDYTLN